MLNNNNDFAVLIYNILVCYVSVFGSTVDSPLLNAVSNDPDSYYSHKGLGSAWTVAQNACKACQQCNNPALGPKGPTIVRGPE